MAKRIRKVKTRAKSMSKKAKLLRRRKYLASLRSGKHRKNPARVRAGKLAARKRKRPIHTAASRRKISLALKAYWRSHKGKRRTRRRAA